MRAVGRIRTFSAVHLLYRQVRLSSVGATAQGDHGDLCGGGRGRTVTGVCPNRFRDGGRRRLSAGSSNFGVASGWPDSNRRPLGSKPSALTKLRYNPEVSPDGIEPPASALSGRRSDLLSYGETARREQGSNLRRTISPVDGLASRSLTTRPTLQNFPTRTRRGTRTPNLPTLNRTPLPLGHPGWVCLRTLGGTRTRTVDVLNVVPLPIGPQGWESGCGESNPGLRHGKAAHCRCATAASSVRGLNPVLRSEGPAVYLPQPHGRLPGPTEWAG